MYIDAAGAAAVNGVLFTVNSPPFCVFMLNPTTLSEPVALKLGVTPVAALVNVI